MGKENAFDIWLGRAVRVAVLVLVGVCCVFVVYVARVAWRMETMLEGSSGHVQQASATAAEIAERVDELAASLDTLTAKMTELELADLGNAAKSLLPGSVQESAVALTPEEAEREIAFLIERIASSGCRFGHDDDEMTARWLSTKLAAKYRFYREQAPNAETFIERIAGRQIDGDPYFILREDGAQQPLAEWLSAALAEHRAGRESPAEE